ncbi:alpha/beta hydrolase-fold protein [Flavobacterium sp. j3]|uniref:Alpha/beta hydrolase-fold protein n=1 Tax=Flavobacterium aureirubrum TaxID=3133147 RepID=A0ABU9N1Z4_9FLAO
MKKSIYLLFLFGSIAYSQVTLRVTQIPNNTPQNATICMPSSLNNWDAAGSALQNLGNGQYQIEIPEAIGTVSYKFTRGSWANVEGNANGGFLPNRSFTFTGNPQTINLTIQSWEDIGASTSTAASNVSILSTSFFMPQLNRSRKIWLYLPPDYYTSTKTYPVIYMQDGQNIFDNATSFSGEWQVDETLNTLFQQGNYGAIVVGIDNGGTERLNEYSPWNNPAYGGGQGDLYSQFIAETLKPYIDSNYRTKPQPQFNALMGSSMGALISSYIGAKYPNLFQKIGNFSAAYWFAKPQLLNFIATNTQNYSNSRMYFVAGSNESATMVTNNNEVKDAFQNKQLATANTLTKYDSYGTHTESYWRGEFGAAYLWLFQNETLANTSFQNDNVIIYKTLSNQLFVEGLTTSQEVFIYSIDGKMVDKITLNNGYNTLNNELQKGIYFIKNASLIKKILL